MNIKKVLILVLAAFLVASCGGVVEPVEINSIENADQPPVTYIIKGEQATYGISFFVTPQGHECVFAGNIGGGVGTHGASPVLECIP